ncbi:DUF6055 domain-containing protein [Maricaulis sp.]|uniref:DUF6055 domain-containing protein n=1 Tax=Maricaulis sp. TaxID=1486257 RepID=UPI002626F9BB|nr:DUF6055 domain-containing protein [Maricaulis sp.]
MRFQLMAPAAFGMAALGASSCADAAPHHQHGHGASDSEGIAGSVTEAAPEFTHTFELEAGQVVTLTTQSDENFDTVLTLSGLGGKPITQNDDADPTTLQSLILFAVPQSGSYTASVTGYGGATGNFELFIEEGVDFGLSDEAVILEEGVTRFSGRELTRDVEVQLNEGDILVASTEALSPELDTTLTLFDASGEVIAMNDDRGDGTLNSQIIFLVETAGEYTVQAGSYSGRDMGELFLSVATDANAELPFDFTALDGEMIATETGRVDDNTPVYRRDITIAEGQTLYAYADRADGDLDPVLRLLGPDGLPVAMNDDRGDGSLNSAFAYTAPATGDYIVEVDRYSGSGSSGGFSLTLSWVEASVVEVLQGLRESIVTLSGDPQSFRTDDFVVNYTLDGEDSTTLAYAQSVGDALQHALDEQLGRMGWREPVRDADGLYRAFVADANGSMGVTYPVETVFDNPHTSDIREPLASRTVFVVENDFEGFDEKTAPVDSLMRATATHEFAHVVQFGYDSEEGLDWLYESTASWIETVTVGHHQDATDYVETDYQRPDLCWTTTQGGFDYSQWTLLQSLADVHGERIVVRIWENAVDHDGFDTMAVTLGEVDTTIPDALRRWRAQNFAMAYELAPLFDRPVALNRSFNTAESWTSKQGPEQLGANYFELALDGRHTISLNGNNALELVALGYRDGTVDVIELGQSGVVDPAAYEHLGLMVFNPVIPEAPGVCSSGMYTLDISATSEAATQPAAYQFEAPHFTAPTPVSEAIE